MANRNYTKVPNYKPFVKLLKFIEAHHGSRYRAARAIGMSDQSYDKLLKDQIISAFVGTKILNHYKEIKANDSTPKLQAS